MSFFSHENFQMPIHLISSIFGGGKVLVSSAKVWTVLRFVGSAFRKAQASSISRNFLEPFLTLERKVSRFSVACSDSSFFRSLFLARCSAACSQSQQAGWRGRPSWASSATVLTRSPTKQSENVSLRIRGL